MAPEHRLATHPQSRLAPLPPPYPDHAPTAPVLTVEAHAGLPSILTLKEVSKELRCSNAHLSHIINGKVAGLPPLPVARIGRRVIIRRENFLAWLSTLEGRNGTMDSDLNSSLETHGKE